MLGRQNYEIFLHYNRFNFPENINSIVSSSDMVNVAGVYWDMNIMRCLTMHAYTCHTFLLLPQTAGSTYATSNMNKLGKDGLKRQVTAFLPTSKLFWRNSVLLQEPSLRQNSRWVEELENSDQWISNASFRNWIMNTWLRQHKVSRCK